MARKAQKDSKKHVPLSKEADDDGTRPWPDLPQQLINVIGWQPALLEDIGYVGVTKSFREQPRQCNNSHAVPPWLELYDGNDDKKFKFSISFHRGEKFWFWRKPRQEPSKYYFGYSDGAIVVNGASPMEYYLDYPKFWGHSYLPPWDPKIPFQRAVLSAINGDYYFKDFVILVLTGISHPAFVFHRQGNFQRECVWIKEDCTIADPHCYNKSERHNFMRFTNAIGYKGKFYALSLHGTLAVIEEIDSHPRIKILGPKRAVPSVSSRHFRECLLESDGEILLVFLISKKSVKIVDDVEVFRLDIDMLLWVMMETLGDRTLFVGSNCCMSVSASKLACRRDSVYFSNHIVEGWWVYDLKSGKISPCRSKENYSQTFTVQIERTKRRVTSINLYMQE